MGGWNAGEADELFVPDIKGRRVWSHLDKREIEYIKLHSNYNNFYVLNSLELLRTVAGTCGFVGRVACVLDQIWNPAAGAATHMSTNVSINFPASLHSTGGPGCGSGKNMPWVSSISQHFSAEEENGRSGLAAVRVGWVEGKVCWRQLHVYG